MKRLVAVTILLLWARAALAQPVALPTEHVTVTGDKAASDATVNHFVQSFTAPSYLTGKAARWETGICPVTMGLAPKFAVFVTRRVREIAAKAGAPVDKDEHCRPNIEIVFTTAPQALANGLRRDHPNYLGYHESNGQADAMASVTHPIQAWYLTATRDLDGNEDVDGGMKVPVPLRLPCPTCNPPYLDFWISGGAKKVTGSRLRDGLRTVFRHVIIAADPTRLSQYEVGALADYIAFLALAQLQSLDTCQTLPSVINLLAPGCDSKPNAMTDGDLGYLHGLYTMSADANLHMQQDGIAYQMKRALDGK
jgi:hypothetical protein